MHRVPDEADDRETVDFCGEKFHVADRIGLMPLMRFAKTARAGVDHMDLEGLASMHDMLEQCIAEDEWVAFQDLAGKVRAGGDELFAVVKDVLGALTARPTSRPSDSSDGPPTTSTSSTADFSSRAKLRLETQGRPDLALMVLEAQEARTA